MAVNNINAQQVPINVSDSIPPDNIATLDKNGKVGSSYSKEQTNDKFTEVATDYNTKINEVREQVKTDFKGTLKPTSPAPTEDGAYKPEISSELDKPSDPNSTADWGAKYPNAGDLRSKTGYDTMFYKKGTVWTKSESKMPEAQNKINTWSAGNYSVGNQVVYSIDQSIYEANAVVTSADIPGVSTKWTKKISGYLEKEITSTTVVRFLNKKSITKVTLSNNVNYTYEGSLAVLNSTEVHEIIPNGYSITFDAIFSTKIQSDIDYSKPISVVFHKPLSSNLKPLAIVVNISEIDNTLPPPKYKVNTAGDARINTWFESFEFASHAVGANDCVFNIGMFNSGGQNLIVGNFTLVGQGAAGRWARFTIPESQWVAGQTYVPDGINIEGVKVKVGSVKPPLEIVTGNTANFTLIPI